MYYSELKKKLLEGMSTSVMNYGLDFQVDVVDGDGGDGEGEEDQRRRLAFKLDKLTQQEKEFQWEKHEMLPWEIKNAIGADERRELVLRWLKAASANNLQSVTNNSIPEIPDWQKVKFKR